MRAVGSIVDKDHLSGMVNTTGGAEQLHGAADGTNHSDKQLREKEHRSGFKSNHQGTGQQSKTTNLPSVIFQNAG